MLFRNLTELPQTIPDADGSDVAFGQTCATSMGNIVVLSRVYVRVRSTKLVYRRSTADEYARLPNRVIVNGEDIYFCNV